MEALGGGGCWGWNIPGKKSRKPFDSGGERSNSKSADSVDVSGKSAFSFPLRQALTAGSLALTGDTIAQVAARWRKRNTLKKTSSSGRDDSAKDEGRAILLDHDWLRALRMTSYGFLLYGPGSYAWYRYLDHCLPQPTVRNIMLKVLLNQIVLGPSVITVVFAWNNLWLQKLSELPNKYQKDLLPTLFFGFRFWIPVSLLNFWIVPLQARVAFMSMGSVFWNFYLSSSMSK